MNRDQSSDGSFYRHYDIYIGHVNKKLLIRSF